MTKLVVGELKTSITQSFKVRLHERQKLQAVRLNLIIYNTPTGDLTLNIKKGGSIISTKTVPIATFISEAHSKLGNTDPYMHGYFKFEFDEVQILEFGDHELELLGVNGYTFTEFNYIGWIQDHENMKNTLVDPENVVNAFDNPYGFELWGLRLGSKLEY